MLGVLPDQQFTQASVTLQAGDQLLLYTDGISEAANAEGEEFGEEQLVEIGRNPQGLASSAMLQSIDQAVRAFHHGEERDDRTMIVLQVH